MIDAHQHFWQVGRFDYPWMKSDNAVLYRDYLPSDLEPVLRENGVSQTVLVQASNSIEESRWLLRLAEENSFIAGVVGWVDLMSLETASQLEELTANPKFKGVRHLVESEPHDDWLVHGEVLNGLKLLAAFDLSYDLLVHTRHLQYARQVAEACPELSLVIDHLAKPPIAAGEFAEWAHALRPLAAFPNVHCKLSGLVTEAIGARAARPHARNATPATNAGGPPALRSDTSAGRSSALRLEWHIEDLEPYVDYALEIFGPERLMFGSDYPVCLLAASYRQVLESFQELLKDLNSEQLDEVFAGNAASFYRLN